MSSFGLDGDLEDFRGTEMAVLIRYVKKALIQMMFFFLFTLGSENHSNTM